MNKHVALFEVKALADGDVNGEFEAILSVPVVDRDGEVVDAGAFEPLPAEIPIHKFHDFSSPVATATPFYEGGVLKARGVFDPDTESQAIRSKVGRSIRYMSVGFMAASREEVDGVLHITKAELLEASFVSVPANREAAILAVKNAFLDQAPSELKLLRELVGKMNATLEEMAASQKDSAQLKTAATDPEGKDAAPAAADEAAAAAAAQPPADVPVGHQARLALLRASAELAAQVAAGT